MMLFELIELFIAVYTSLGFGTKEYKIEAKMEKLSKHSPHIWESYLRNKNHFETDEHLSALILTTKIKNVAQRQSLIKLIEGQF